MKRYIKSSIVALDAENFDGKNSVAKYSARDSILSQLAEDKSGGIRVAVARNPNTPAEVLHKLSDDVAWVRREVALNPNTDIETLRKLTKDTNTSVTHALLLNDKLPWSERAPILNGPCPYHMELDVYFKVTGLSNSIWELPEPLERQLNSMGYECTLCVIDNDPDYHNGEWYVRAYCDKIFSLKDVRNALDVIGSAIANAGGTVTDDEYVIDG